MARNKRGSKENSLTQPENQQNMSSQGHSLQQLPSGDQLQSINRYSPEQQQVLNMFREQVNPYMQMLMQRPDTRQQRAQAYRDFRGNVLPQLSERFAGSDPMGGASSARDRARGEALSSFGTNLAQMEEQSQREHRQQVLQGLQPLIQMGLQPQTEQEIIPEEPSNFENFTAGISKEAPKALTKLMGSEFGQNLLNKGLDMGTSALADFIPMGNTAKTALRFLPSAIRGAYGYFTGGGQQSEGQAQQQQQQQPTRTRRPVNQPQGIQPQPTSTPVERERRKNIQNVRKSSKNGEFSFNTFKNSKSTKSRPDNKADELLTPFQQRLSNMMKWAQYVGSKRGNAPKLGRPLRDSSLKFGT